MTSKDHSPAAKEAPRARRWRQLARLARDPKRMWREHRRLTIALGFAAAVLLAAIVVGYELLKRPPDVHNANVAFKPQKPPKPKETTVNWPMYGLNPARTRYLPAKGIKPPFRLLWRYTERPLLEFPPVYVRRQALRGQQQRRRLRAGREHRARCSGNARSADSTPPRRPITSTASTSSTSPPATW